MDDPNDRPHARAPRPEDLARICRALNECGARYVLIGGFAVIVHGLVRPTKDIELLIEDSDENVRLVKEALGVLADNAAVDVQDDDVRRYAVVRIADEIIVDLMGRACGLDHEAASRNLESIELAGVTIPVASARTLIRTKMTPRPSDVSDRAFLESRLEKGDK